MSGPRAGMAWNPPPDGALVAVLEALAGGRLAVMRRKANAYATTFPAEVITCRDADGAPLRFLCKYSAVSGWHGFFGHRGGLEREARVYAEILQPLRSSVPRLYGLHREPDTGVSWLILEYLHGAVRVSKHRDPAMMPAAAAWIGRFHSDSAGVCPAARHVVPSYGRRYYAGWVRRTLEFARSLPGSGRWFEAACARFKKLSIPLLLRRPITVHGEYYTANVLAHQGLIHPVDWESAALAAGEIDLACLTERWPVERVREMEAAYAAARWGADVPADFEEALAAARFYLHLRWLGEASARGLDGDSLRWRLEALGDLSAARAGGRSG